MCQIWFGKKKEEEEYGLYMVQVYRFEYWMEWFKDAANASCVWCQSKVISVIPMNTKHKNVLIKQQKYNQNLLF